MDQHLEYTLQKRMERTAAALNRHQFDARIMQNREELLQTIKQMLPKGAKVALGGSMTLAETGVQKLLEEGDWEYYDRYAPGLTPEQVVEVFRKAFFTDYYFTSTNAVSEDGQLFNIDGNGNRVAAMLYGPSNVVVVVGANKIVKDEEEAWWRIQNIATPANARRLSRKSGCVDLGRCVNCQLEQRLCRDFVKIHSCMVPERIKVFILPESLGY